MDVVRFFFLLFSVVSLVCFVGCFPGGFSAASCCVSLVLFWPVMVFNKAAIQKKNLVYKLHDFIACTCEM